MDLGWRAKTHLELSAPVLHLGRNEVDLFFHGAINMVKKTRIASLVESATRSSGEMIATSKNKGWHSNLFMNSKREVLMRASGATDMEELRPFFGVNSTINFNS